MPNLNRKVTVAIIFVIALVAGVSIARADVLVKSRQTAAGQTYENQIMIKGKRQRTESMNGQMITIQQCDLRRDLLLMPASMVYTVTRYDQTATPQRNANFNGPVAPVSKGGVVTMTVTSRDTGERKQMFGYTARHLISTMVMQSSPDACNQVNTKMEIDGWYIDATFALECDINRNAYAGAQGSNGGCQDRYETKQVGAVKRGFAVWEKTTMYGPNGAESFTSTNEVVDISQTTLDAALFDVPAGYREVQDFSQASMAGASNRTTPQSAAGGNGGSSSNGVNGNPSPRTPPRSNTTPSAVSNPPLRLGKPW
jgi:hypothetical protein